MRATTPLWRGVVEARRVWIPAGPRAHESVLARWAEQGQVALRYRARKESPQLVAVGAGANEPLLPYPENPNGSIANIAGLCDPSGRILGLMPHPERFLFATQHPQWTRKRLTGDGDGRKIFQNAVDYFA